jgi:hypothetical protein
MVQRPEQQRDVEPRVAERELARVAELSGEARVQARAHGARLRDVLGNGVDELDAMTGAPAPPPTSTTSSGPGGR